MAVVENGSLSKAARVMNRTTPPIAKSIKDFETSLGKRLFKREKFGMTLIRMARNFIMILGIFIYRRKKLLKNIFQATLLMRLIFIMTGEKKGT